MNSMTDILSLKQSRFSYVTVPMTILLTSQSHSSSSYQLF